MNTPDIHAALDRLGLTLPSPVAPIASYVPVVQPFESDLLFVSGQVPLRDGALIASGQIPNDVSIEVGQDCARQCVLNGLAAAGVFLGDLARLRRVVKVEGFVACGAGFAAHPQVINGASDLLLELMGDSGRHARAAVGVPSLPLDAPVEIAFVFQAHRGQ